MTINPSRTDTLPHIRDSDLSVAFTEAGAFAQAHLTPYEAIDPQQLLDSIATSIFGVDVGELSHYRSGR